VEGIVQLVGRDSEKNGDVAKPKARFGFRADGKPGLRERGKTREGQKARPERSRNSIVERQWKQKNGEKSCIEKQKLVGGGDRRTEDAHGDGMSKEKKQKKAQSKKGGAWLKRKEDSREKGF